MRLKEQAQGSVRVNGQPGLGERHLDFAGFSSSFFQTLETELLNGGYSDSSKESGEGALGLPPSLVCCPGQI